MKQMNRAVHFDFHTMPGIDDFLQNFDPKDFARQMQKANADYVNIFARCNIGYSYYNTKVGKPYPEMRGEPAKEIMAALKEKGIGVTLYLNGGLNHRLFAEHPEFLKITKEGKVYDFSEGENFFRTPCYNSGFADYLLEEIKEVARLDPDGIFVDCLQVRSCYCPNCIKKMKEAGVDISNDSEVFLYSTNLLKEFFAKIRAVVPKDMRLYLNSFPYEEIAEYQSHAELECLPTSVWGYDYFCAQAPYYRMFSKDRVYMTGKFITDWGDFGGAKSRAAVESDVFDALLCGYKPSVGDHMHPRDGADEQLYKTVGEIYALVKKLENWTKKTEPLCEAAILRNKTEHIKDIQNLLTDSDKGAARMFWELKICFNVINEDMDFSPYKLLVIPENTKITNTLQKKLDGFCGSVLACGNSITNGAKSFAEFFEDDNTDGFFEYGGKVLGQYSTGVKLKSEYGISNYVEPYFKKGFDGLQYYFYNPPKACKGFCAAALKENYAHIGFNVFEGYLKSGSTEIKNFVEQVLNRLLPKKMIKANDLPSYVRASLFGGKGKTLLHIKTTVPELRGEKGIIEDHIYLPRGKKICVLGNFKSARTLPELKAAKVEQNGEYTQITLPEICGYKCFLLE